MKVEDISFKELTKRVQSQLLKCMAHAYAPTQKLIEATNTTRIGNYSPFFQCMFVMNQPVQDYLRTTYPSFFIL